MNIFEALRKDHDHQRHLVRSLGETSGDTKTRRFLFDELKNALTHHADMEERYFYSPLIGEDLTQAKARHSIAEHHELDEYIEKLENVDMNTAQWMKTFKDLEHRLLHHLGEEEKEIFPVAGKVLSEQKKESLGAQYTENVEKREKQDGK